MTDIEKAADSLYNYFDKRFHIKIVLLDIKEDEKGAGFHYGTGKALRATLLELGYSEEVTSQYSEILQLVYEKAGIK